MAKASMKPSRTERSERAKVIHTDLDEAASLINSVHADVLRRVIEAKAWNIHRDVDGFSGLRDWLVSTFDFHLRTAADLAAIARTAGKFTVLAETATSARARIDRVAAAVRRLDATKALRVYARTPYQEPVPSPFDADTLCPTPEHLVAEYCIHATVKDVHAHLDELQAVLDSGEELLDGLGQQSLQRLDLVETENGMFVLSGLLSADTGKLFAKLLTTAVPPPRQDEVDEDGSLPPASNRRAEALHQVLAAHGADANAAKRHGHTATLNVTVDIETLAGEDTGRVPTLEGDPISLGKARLLACEGVVIPSVFNYRTGEAIELGRALRLPNSALRRKLELEQPGGCAWDGCRAPVQWTEAHHIVHWANGGPTVAENLILLCRFHHGRIHTPGWSITKTGPGKALIVHHEGHDDTDPDLKCGCADYRTDTDLDLDFTDDIANVFPTGLYPEEWSETLKPDLEAAAERAETAQAIAAAKTARAKARARFTTTAPQLETEPETTSELASTPAPEPRHGHGRGRETSTLSTGPKRTRELVGAASAAPAPDYGPPPFLLRPSRGCRGGEEGLIPGQLETGDGFEPFSMPTLRTGPPATRSTAPQPATRQPRTAPPTTSAPTSQPQPTRHTAFVAAHSAAAPSTRKGRQRRRCQCRPHQAPRPTTPAPTTATSPNRPATSPSPPQRRTSIHDTVPANARAAISGLTRPSPIRSTSVQRRARPHPCVQFATFRGSATSRGSRPGPDRRNEGGSGTMARLPHRPMSRGSYRHSCGDGRSSAPDCNIFQPTLPIRPDVCGTGNGSPLRLEHTPGGALPPMDHDTDRSVTLLTDPHSRRLGRSSGSGQRIATVRGILTILVASLAGIASMRTLTRRLLAVAAVAATTALALAAPSTASAEPLTPETTDAPQVETLELPAIDGFAAAPLDEYEAAPAQQPPDAFECMWGWTVEVGGFYPEAWMQYAATFECSQIGPDMAGTLVGSLRDAPGGLTLHTGPQEAFAWCCFMVYPPASSGGEVTLTGPDSFYINSQSEIVLAPTDGNVWVWTYLPAGCTGIGSPIALCDIDSEPFDIT